MRLRCRIPVTRLFTILLLIVLLPLRGWAVERMAVDMAAGAMPADCHMVHMVQAAPADADAAEGSDTSLTEGTCHSCQLCMSLVALDTPAVHMVCPAPLAATMHPADRFVSADLSRSIKPPIS